MKLRMDSLFNDVNKCMEELLPDKHASIVELLTLTDGELSPTNLSSMLTLAQSSGSKCYYDMYRGFYDVWANMVQLWKEKDSLHDWSSINAQKIPGRMANLSNICRAAKISDRPPDAQVHFSVGHMLL